VLNDDIDTTSCLTVQDFESRSRIASELALLSRSAEDPSSPAKTNINPLLAHAAWPLRCAGLTDPSGSNFVHNPVESEKSHVSLN
jgi:hypothetical protein